MLALSAGLLCHSCKEKPSPVDYADPTIGGVSVLLETTRQTIHLPNEMLRFMPLRSSMLDDWIGDFSLQMVNHRTLWAYAFMPFCTPTPEENWGKPGVCNNEETHPHYYHAQLDGVDLEFTPSRHSGIMRLTYQGEGLRTIRLRTRTKTGGFSLANRVLTGTAETGNLTVYLYAEFDADMTDIHQLNNEQQLMLTSGEASAGRQLHMRYGLSYISTEQARANLEREIPDFDFDRTRRQAEEAWNARLGQIEVKGGSDDQRRTFYTALYRCSERMVNIDEYGRHYSAYDHQVHESERPFYVDNWIWDTYIALEPLHILRVIGTEGVVKRNSPGIFSRQIRSQSVRLFFRKRHVEHGHVQDRFGFRMKEIPNQEENSCSNPYCRCARPYIISQKTFPARLHDASSVSVFPLRNPTCG